MKKLITLTLSGIMALSFVACNNTDTNTSSNTTKNSIVKIPNPYVGCENIEDATEMAGFDISIPDYISSYTERTIRAIENSMIEAIYHDGEKTISIRKSVGTDDISGDYNTYAENNVVEAGSLQISTHGSNGMVNVATWTNSNNTFAMNISEGMGIEAVVELIADIQ